MKTYWGSASIASCPGRFYTRGNSNRYPLNRRPDGSQYRYGGGGEEKNSRNFHCRELNPGLPIRSLVSILTDVVRLCNYRKMRYVIGWKETRTFSKFPNHSEQIKRKQCLWRLLECFLKCMGVQCIHLDISKAVKLKVKVKSLCLTKHQAMRMYGGVEV